MVRELGLSHNLKLCQSLNIQLELGTEHELEFGGWTEPVSGGGAESELESELGWVPGLKLEIMHKLRPDGNWLKL